MTDALFDLDEPIRPEAPRCRLCARSARWNAVQNRWSAYCAGASCSNIERVCSQCGRTFTQGIDGAGTKYCSPDCKDAGYHPLRKPRAVCAWCGRTSDQGARGQVWPYVCDDCLAPIRHVVPRLKAHHVSHERARKLRDDPQCEAGCGRDLLAKMKDPATGKTRAWLVVDHDHACCPADAHSCGACVRGLICSHCNTAAGLLRDNPTTARALAVYLDRFFR